MLILYRFWNENVTKRSYIITQEIKSFLFLKELIANFYVVSQKNTFSSFFGSKYFEIIICKKIFGFNNHLWNGVTISVFSHILYTIINKKINIPNNFHLIPKDKVNKFKLMQLLKNHYGFKNL